MNKNDIDIRSKQFFQKRSNSRTFKWFMIRRVAEFLGKGINVVSYFTTL